MKKKIAVTGNAKEMQLLKPRTGKIIPRTEWEAILKTMNCSLDVDFKDWDATLADGLAATDDIQTATSPARKGWESQIKTVIAEHGLEPIDHAWLSFPNHATDREIDW